MAGERKGNEDVRGLPTFVDGRVEELRRLQACEWALADAYAAYARTASDRARLVRIGERHRAHAARLAARLCALGGRPDVAPDDSWLSGPADELATLVLAEHTAQRVYHDHLLDLDPESLMLVRNCILPEHEEVLAELLGESEPTAIYGA